MEIYKRISDMMSEIGGISKDRKNLSQGYQFRGIDDVYNSLNPLMAKFRIFTVPTVLSETRERVTNAKGTALIYVTLKMSFKFFTDDGSFIEATVIGEGMDSGDKASNKAMSVAHKYALLQVFAIPTIDDKDPEVDHHEVVVPKKDELPPMMDMFKKVVQEKASVGTNAQLTELKKAFLKLTEGMPMSDSQVEFKKIHCDLSQGISEPIKLQKEINLLKMAIGKIELENKRPADGEQVIF